MTFLIYSFVLSNNYPQFLQTQRELWGLSQPSLCKRLENSQERPPVHHRISCTNRARNIKTVLPWCNCVKYCVPHVDISEMLYGNIGLIFTDWLFNETSFRTFLSCPVCKAVCPRSARDWLCLISITTAAAQTLKTRKLGNEHAQFPEEGPGVASISLFTIYSSLVICLPTPFVPVCPLPSYRHFCWVWHVWNSGAEKGQCSGKKANTSLILRSNAESVIAQESMSPFEGWEKEEKKRSWKVKRGCAESSWEPPCSGRLIEALGGSRLWAVTPMKSPFAAFCRPCAEFWWSPNMPRPLCHEHPLTHTHTHKLGHTHTPRLSPRW